jgi:hypothetical protein
MMGADEKFRWRIGYEEACESLAPVAARADVRIPALAPGLPHPFLDLPAAGIALPWTFCRVVANRFPNLPVMGFAVVKA